MNKFVTMALAFAMAATANASLLTLEKGNSAIAGVNLAKSATAAVGADKANVTLTNVGAGLRNKKVLFTNVKVYVTQLLVSSPTRFAKGKMNEALKSLDDSSTVALMLSFVRDVEAEKVQTAFRDGLIANKVDFKDPAIAAFLKAVETSGDASDGKSMVILMNKNSDGTEELSYEPTNGNVTVVKGEKGLTQKIMSIWLGVPADSGLETLKDSIINGTL